MSEQYELSGWDLSELLPDATNATVSARLSELDQAVTAFVEAHRTTSPLIWIQRNCWKWFVAMRQFRKRPMSSALMAASGLLPTPSPGSNELPQPDPAGFDRDAESAALF